MHLSSSPHHLLVFGPPISLIFISSFWNVCQWQLLLSSFLKLLLGCRAFVATNEELLKCPNIDAQKTKLLSMKSDYGTMIKNSTSSASGAKQRSTVSLTQTRGAEESGVYNKNCVAKSH
jgi:hypothetical protein